MVQTVYFYTVCLMFAVISILLMAFAIDSLKIVALDTLKSAIASKSHSIVYVIIGTFFNTYLYTIISWTG